jgi:hypothetical protein
MADAKQGQVDVQVETPRNLKSIRDLVEMSVWLGTYGERMRLASSEDQQQLAENVRRGNDRLLHRRKLA